MAPMSERNQIVTEAVTADGSVITADEAARLADAFEVDDTDLGEGHVVHVGRPSLTAPGTHSPKISTRVTPEFREQLARKAASEGLTLAAAQRKALENYVYGDFGVA
jgi:hypothetical protein